VWLVCSASTLCLAGGINCTSWEILSNSTYNQFGSLLSTALEGALILMYLTEKVAKGLIPWSPIGGAWCCMSQPNECAVVGVIYCSLLGSGGAMLRHSG